MRGQFAINELCMPWEELMNVRDGLIKYKRMHVHFGRKLFKILQYISWGIASGFGASQSIKKTLQLRIIVPVTWSYDA